MHTMMIGILVGLALPASAAAQPPIRDGEHVRVEGTRFTVGGRPFHFVGANAGVRQ